jgi:hypothetical protein
MNGTTWNVVEMSVGLFFAASLIIAMGMMMLCISCYKPSYDFQGKKLAHSRTLHTVQSERETFLK